MHDIKTAYTHNYETLKACHNSVQNYHIAFVFCDYNFNL